MKSKSVDLEINEANDGDNNSNVSWITIATVKIENYNICNNIGNKESNRNTNNIGNNDDNVSLLMTKTMIIVLIKN